MQYGFTLNRDAVAEQPAPLRYLTDLTREAERLGFAHAVIGDRLESGVDPFLVLTAIAEAAGRMQLVTSVVILPPRGVLVTAKQFGGQRRQRCQHEGGGTQSSPQHVHPGLLVVDSISPGDSH